MIGQQRKYFWKEFFENFNCDNVTLGELLQSHKITGFPLPHLPPVHEKHLLLYELRHSNMC